ncbi:MAG: OsmC family protein [Saprospiraceae bacterium]|nr:OsmC family protein [Saprospiraceae bacterium]
MKAIEYRLKLEWTGNLGKGTFGYTQYDRSYRVSMDGKPDLDLSADVHFRGEPNKYNPEEMLLMAVSSCHMLWYLHLCADAGVIVMNYIDRPEATLTFDQNGVGRMEGFVLKPEVSISPDSNASRAIELHKEANKRCFIANSLNVPIHHKPVVL